MSRLVCVVVALITLAPLASCTARQHPCPFEQGGIPDVVKHLTTCSEHLHEAIQQLAIRQRLPAESGIRTGDNDSYFAKGLVRVLGNDPSHLLVLLEPLGWSIPGTSRVRVLLLHQEKGIVDKVDVEAATREVLLSLSSVEDEATGRIEVRVLGHTPNPLGVMSFDVVLPDHKVTVKRGSPVWPGTWEVDGLCRIGVNKGRLAVVSPRVKD